ncbi:MAG: hypothetical protein PSV35_06840 [bacterium]|nr:hypothetical protein [bacterium]
MKKHVWRLSFLFSNLLCIGAQAGVTVIVSPAPPLQEIVTIPSGYKTCYFVRPGFYNGVWHYKHRVCEYSVNSGTRMWISGYWQCVSYRPGGRCTNTTWIGSHWAGHHDIEYTMNARGAPRSRVYIANDRGAWQPHHHGHWQEQGTHGASTQYHGHTVHPLQRGEYHGHGSPSLQGTIQTGPQHGHQGQSGNNQGYGEHGHR